MDRRPVEHQLWEVSGIQIKLCGWKFMQSKWNPGWLDIQSAEVYGVQMYIQSSTLITDDRLLRGLERS
ncbi:unnamed protein product [Larinioides sclopetarius]|uniref:Uncharacterized protein n=1 Tax=Larinioides sclopetarius TaxID=280406 RepID=A0AAV2BR09_9ARAC